MFQDKDIGVVLFPIVYNKKGEALPVDKKDLPILLPEDVDLNVKGNPLEKHPTWKFTKLSSGEKVIRETDTLDTFVDSSWYFLRFCSPKYEKYGYEIEDINYWMPVDQYIGGVEHAILHLLYSRFFMRALAFNNKNLIILSHLKAYLHKVWFVTKLIKMKIINGYIQMK